MSAILAIGAHPDDIEFGCFGLLHELMRLDPSRKVTCYVATNGGLCGGRRAGSRLDETFKALLFLPRAVNIVGGHYDMLDGELDRKVKALTQDLDACIATYKPSLVLTHAPWDSHQDHRALWTASQAACRRSTITLLSYYSGSATEEFVPNVYQQLSPALLGKKIRALKEHKSQLNKPYFEMQWLHAWHRDTAGMLAGVQFVERFHLHRMFA